MPASNCDRFLTGVTIVHLYNVHAKKLQYTKDVQVPELCHLVI